MIRNTVYVSHTQYGTTDDAVAIDTLAVPSSPRASSRLVLEVDGDYPRDRTHADRRRDRVLARLGTRVLRLEAGLVLHQLAVAVTRIQAALAGR